MRILHAWCSFVIGITFSSLVTASWPGFFIPSVEQLAMEQVFDQANCPQGYGKILQGKFFHVNAFTKSFCPNDWLWIAENESKCVDIKNLDFLNYKIDYLYSEQSILKSIITAFYGKDGIPLVSFRFATPDKFWLCYETNANKHYFTCANDI